MVTLVIYVDDIFIIGCEVEEIDKVKSELCLTFDMIGLGLPWCFKSVEV